MGRACACLPAAAAPKDRAPSTFIVGGEGAGAGGTRPRAPPRRGGLEGPRSRVGFGPGWTAPSGDPFRWRRHAPLCITGGVSAQRKGSGGLWSGECAEGAREPCSHIGSRTSRASGGTRRQWWTCGNWSASTSGWARTGGGHDHRPHPPPREFTRPPRQPLALLSEGQGRGPSPVCAPVGSGQAGQARDGLTTSRAVGLGKVTGWHGDPCPNGSGLGRGTRGTPQGDW